MIMMLLAPNGMIIIIPKKNLYFLIIMNIKNWKIILNLFK